MAIPVAIDSGSVTGADVVRIDVQRLIPASPTDILEALSDPRGHVAIDDSWVMLMAASGERVHAVGDSFIVHMDRGTQRPPWGISDATVANRSRLVPSMLTMRGAAGATRGQPSLPAGAAGEVGRQGQGGGDEHRPQPSRPGSL